MIEVTRTTPITTPNPSRSLLLIVSLTVRSPNSFSPCPESLGRTTSQAGAKCPTPSATFSCYGRQPNLESLLVFQNGSRNRMRQRPLVMDCAELERLQRVHLESVGWIP